MTTEIILLGHGSRRREANEGLIEVAHKVETILGEKLPRHLWRMPNPACRKLWRRK